MTILSFFIAESRFVTMASRDLVRRIRRNMERTYGQGLVNLIHPVTKEFNHKLVIEQRGGRHEYEQITDNWKNSYIHKPLGAMHSLFVKDGHKRWDNIAGNPVDKYDTMSFFYGWIVAM